jgi:hypothetical protein
MTCGALWWLDGHPHVYGDLEGKRPFERRRRKLLLLLFNCNWAYAGWQCYKNWTYIQEMDIHSKETKHTTHDKAARTTHKW